MLFASLKILIAYFYSWTPKTLLFTVEISLFLAQNWNRCNFGWRLLKFGFHGNSFWFLKNSDNIMWIRWLLRPEDSVLAKNFSVFYTEMNFVQFWLVFAYLVAIATLFAPWKIQMAYFNSTTPKPYHICRNWRYIAYRTEICAFLSFLCKFGCYGNSLCSRKIFISIFEFSDPENHTIHANIVSIAFTELKSAEFWFILT